MHRLLAGVDPGEECPEPSVCEVFWVKRSIGGYFVRPASGCEGAVQPFAVFAVERHLDESKFWVDSFYPEVILIPVAVQVLVLLVHDNGIAVVGAGTENQTPCIQQSLDPIPPKVPQGAEIPSEWNENPQANTEVQERVVAQVFHVISFREF